MKTAAVLNIQTSLYVWLVFLERSGLASSLRSQIGSIQMNGTMREHHDLSVCLNAACICFDEEFQATHTSDLSARSPTCLCPGAVRKNTNANCRIQLLERALGRAHTFTYHKIVH